MSKLKINGGLPLNGEIHIKGNKNAALPIIAASILTDEDCIIENLPDIRDVGVMLTILKKLGKRIHFTSNHVCKISGSVAVTCLDAEAAGLLRASILFLAPLLAKYGEVTTSPPGGCVIGRRNIDSHFEVIRAFGSKISTLNHQYHAILKKAKPAKIFLKEASVTATENALLLAAATPGKSVIENAACEPHISDLITVLNKMGSFITGSGTNYLEIDGQSKLHGFTHSIIPDHIEAGTYAIAAACTKGKLVIHNVVNHHLKMINYYLQQMNVSLDFVSHASLIVKPSNLVSNLKTIKAGIWPGFPTDLMSPMIVLATQTEGMVLCHDWMYESRMFFIDKLCIMGANIIQCDPHRVVVSGPTQLKGQVLSSPDIRAGMALVIAALAAQGTSVIDNAEIIDRGYEKIENKLKQIGADIQRIT
ncbi:MAG: UDP-N-acetylglucosamine 1-carboxyvinyltransferase [Fidelibacterota bacterium]